ncbi:unnamed protein product [Prunus armeniaca]
MRRSIGALNAQARLAGHYCASRRFVLLNETTASKLPPRHLACERTVKLHRLSREPCPFWPPPPPPPGSFSRTRVEPYPRIPASWPDPNGFLPPAIHQLSFVLESRRGPRPWCGRDSFPALGRMTFLLMRPWRNCNAIDEDGRAWCDDSNLAMFVWPSTLVAPMAGVTVLASPSHSYAQNDGPGHGPSDSLDCNLVSPMSRVTSSPMVGMTALTLAGCTCVQSDGLGHGPSDGLDYNPGSPISRVTSLPMAAVSGNVGGGGTA